MNATRVAGWAAIAGLRALLDGIGWIGSFVLGLLLGLARALMR